MSNTTILIIVMFLNLTFSTIMDVLAKYWNVTNNILFFYLSMGASIFTMFFYICMIKYGSLTISSTITLLLTMIISVSIGYFYFHEVVKPIQWVGIFLSFISILLMLNIFHQD